MFLLKGEHFTAIAEQEMLHLALAGNMLCSLDGKQALYDKCFMPTYPSEILFDKIPMKLQPANKENLECFLKVSPMSRLSEPSADGGSDRSSVYAAASPAARAAHVHGHGYGHRTKGIHT